jgi:N-sulfoglucosamine sulfohydrolase
MRLHAVIALLLFGLFCPSPVVGSGNVVLIVADDHGRDAGCYGNAVIKTPHLDALAADGTRFENAYCTTASCSPSRSVILTGRYNHANGMYGLQHGVNHFRSYENLKSLPVWLSDVGYRTVQIGKLHVAPEHVYQFDETLRANSRNPVQMAERCREVIASDSDRPFFLYFCPSDPHRSGPEHNLPHRSDGFGNKSPGKSYAGVEPVHYDPADVIVPPFLPDTPACRAELAQYYESVSRMDAGVGRLVQILKEAGKYDDTLIIYISDNGIPFPGAKTTVYEPGIRLPCIVRSPNVQGRGVINRAMVNWADIAPTILEFAETKRPGDANLHGRSFLPIVEQQSPVGWNELYVSHTFHEVTMYYPMRVVRRGPYKLIWNIAHPLPFPFAADLWNSATWQDAQGRGDYFKYGERTISVYTNRPEFELYDLEADPNEVQNLADAPPHRKTLTQLQQKLRGFQKRTDDPWALKWDRE